MDFAPAVRSCPQKRAVPQGRASRPEYWWFVLFGFGVVGLLASLALLLPGVCADIRRLHDTDRSGGWLLTGFAGSVGGGGVGTLFLPLGALIMLGALGYLIFLLVQPGTPGPNRFGAAA